MRAQGAPAPGAPVSQAPMCARTYNIRELGNEQGLVWQEVYWKIGTSIKKVLKY